MDNFVKDQWNQFCSNLERTAKHFASDNQKLLDKYLESASQFHDSKSPESYYELLTAIAEGTKLAVDWQND